MPSQEGSRVKRQVFLPLTTYHRFYIYAIHGYVTEVMFTAAWEFVVHFNWKFPGNTSVWSLPIYGISGMVMEQLFFFLKDHGIPIYIRCFVYMMWTYVWEFSTGYVLKYFDACPWDYSLFEGEFMGLITLEYAPLWYLAGYISECVIIKLTRQLYWGPFVQDGTIPEPVNGEIKSKDK